MIRLVLALGLALAPAVAQAQPARSAATQPGPNETYVHQGSRMGAPPELAGFTRGEVRDATGTGRDVSVQYRSPDTGTVLTVYFYRSAYPNPALWFVQARRSLEMNPRFGGLAGSDRPARTFATPNAASDGLMVSYPLSGDQRSTALALTAAGEWLVKLRMTSSTLDEAAISDRIAAAAAALVWPRRAEAAGSAAIPSCGAPLPAAREARAARSTDRLAAEASRQLTASVVQPRNGRLCFDRQEQMLGIYQETEQAGGYLLALGDSGRFARVRRLSPAAADNLYVVDFYDLDAAYIAGFFEGLPTPEQALQASDSAFRSGGIARVGYVDSEIRPDESGALPVT